MLVHAPASPKILVVDATVELLTLYRELLGDEGFRFEGWLAPPADLSEVQRSSADMIVLDLRLVPPKSGWDFLERLKNDPSTSSIPVLVTTVDSNQIDALRDQLVRWDCATLLKPFDVEDLLSAIRNCICAQIPGHEFVWSDLSVSPCL
jgi:CheY-like chemotaxis protein